VSLALALLLSLGLAGDPAAEWGSWRGPLGTGEAPLADPPIRWSETENVRWRPAPCAWRTSTHLPWPRLGVST
jgi:hypothetical protein